MLTAAGCINIDEEKVSSARSDRPELGRLRDHLRDTDVVVITMLDRLARSTKDLLDIAEQLNKKNAGLVFGRPTAPQGGQIALGQKLLEEGQSQRQVANAFEMHPATIYRVFHSTIQASQPA